MKTSKHLLLDLFRTDAHVLFVSVSDVIAFLYERGQIELAQEITERSNAARRGMEKKEELRSLNSSASASTWTADPGLLEIPKHKDERWYKKFLP